MLDVKKIIICAVAAIGVLSGGAYIVYSKYIVPKYIEPVLETTADMLKDSDIQEALSGFAEELVANGSLDKETLKAYEKNINKYTKKNTSSGVSSSDAYSDSKSDNTQELKDETTTIISSASSELGIKTVNTDPSVKGVAGQKMSDKYRIKDEEDDAPPEDKTYQGSSASSDNSDSSSNDKTSKEDKEAVLYKKIINAMTPHERSVFYSVMLKADETKLRSIYASPNARAEAKEYLSSILNESEYSEAVTIFFKYAHLLYEE